MRKNSVFILLLVVLLSLPTFAFADASTEELSGGKGVGWQGIITSGDDTGLYGVVGRARNKYNMACWVMGKNPLTIADEVRSKLSDPNYGGRFYEYANTFESIPSWDYVPEWQPTYTNLTYVLYGFDFQWESAVPQSLYEGAKEDFRRVLAGEDLGGGGSGGVVDGIPAGDYYELTLSSNYYPFPSAYHPHVVYLSVDLYNMWLNDSHTAGRNLYFFARGGNGVSNPGTAFSVGFWWCRSMWADGGTYRPIRWTGGVDNYWTDDVVRNYVNNKLFCYSYPSSDSFSHWYSFPDSTSSNDKAGTAYMIYKFNPSDWPIVHYGNPGGDWPVPDTPATPTAPEVPTPTAPTVTPDPTPTEPTPTWPVIPTPSAPTVVTVVTPEGLDYTQLLTLINDNLNDINSYIVAINSSLNSLRSDLVTEFDGVTQGLRNIYQYLQHLDDLLERHCKHLRDALDDGIYNLELYIKSLFEWLPQQLDFDAKFDYDDTTVTSLLRRILGKIPGGTGDAPTSYMPNPQADEPGFFDWLLDLWHRFLIDLVSVLPDELGGLVDAFSQLTHYFPFSIPWDLAALLALFEHEPVTPVFDVPWGFGGEEGEIEMVRVDLSSWDGVMEMVRPVFLVGFCWQLAMITKDLLANFDINKGGV